LVAAEGLSWQDRAHFFAVAAQMMRRILVDAARTRAAAKRGGDPVRVTFSEELAIPAGNDADLLAVDDALTALAKLDPRKARVVELRFFAGLTVNETAEVLKISPDSVMRDWRLAKPWLAREVVRRDAPVVLRATQGDEKPKLGTEPRPRGSGFSRDRHGA
jgi:RNA polymerase sigma factor (TIGR02999 family)